MGGPKSLGIRRGWNWLRWLAALGLLGWLGFSQRTAVLQIAGAPKAWGYLVLALVTLLITYLITFLRWWVLVRAQRIPFPPREAIRLGFIGLISNFVTPGAVGGDIVKAFLMGRNQTRRRAVAVATVILDRMLGLLALFLVGALVSLVPSPVLDHPSLAPVRWLMWIGSGVGLTGLVVMLLPRLSHARLLLSLERLPRLGPLARELIEGVALYQSRPGAIWLALGLGLICQLGLITGFHFCALWMKQAWTPDLVSHLFMLPTAQLFAAFMPVPAGTGALEGAMQWFYERVRPDTISSQAAGAAGFLAALAFRLVTMAIAGLGGGYYLTSRREISRAMAPPTDPSRP
jgi:uncharacterized membrane protein YbhN (UPF0104 family)